MDIRNSIKSYLFTIFVICSIIASSAQSQDAYYTNKYFGETLTYSPLDSKVCIKFSKSARFDEMTAITASSGLSSMTEALEKLHFGVFEMPAGTTILETKAQLMANAKVAGVIPVYLNRAGYEFYIDPEWFSIRLEEHVSDSEAKHLLKKWGSRIAINEFAPGYFTATIPVGMTVWETLRAFSELPEVKFAEPYSYGFNEACEDTYLESQWNLINTGQECGEIQGNDINVSDAWDITYGDSDVVIVIVDTGIDLTHPDLSDNIVPRGTEDWDFEDPDSVPDDEDREGHGTNCAGTAVALMNSIGVRGVAPSCRVMPLRVPLDGGRTKRANAIDYAVTRCDDFSAMVISCSWHTGGDSHAGIHSAIDDAVDEEIPVFFAAGNNNTDVYYPAAYSKTIAVGAMSPDQKRKDPNTCDGEDDWGSNYGEDLDISAPGVRIYTTDRQGDDGYNDSAKFPPENDLEDKDYTRYFWGTSAACPQVAAVAALILSANPDLTESQVRDALFNTADEVGGYTYTNGKSDELGYGRVDAYEAVCYFPPRPTNLSAGADGFNAVLSWDDNSDNEDGFKIDRRVNGGSWTVNYATRPANSESYEDENLSHTNAYEYRIRAYDGTRYSSYSEIASVPYTVWITGPSWLDNQERGTWTANCVGASGTPSYQWWKKLDGQSTWSTLGTSRTQSVIMRGVGFTLKVGITVGGNYEEDTHHVNCGMPRGPIRGEKSDGSLEEIALPDVFALHANYPNPFNPETTIRFDLPEALHVTLSVFDIQGRVVSTLIDRNMPVGFHNASFNAVNLPAGVYFYRIEAGEFSMIRRMLLLK